MTSGRSLDISEDDELKEALAVLISCTRNKKRPLPLTQIAKWLEIARKKLGTHTAVANRIGLSPKMLRQFSYVRRLAEPVQDLFENRQLDSVDAATHLAMLLPADQKAVARSLASKEIDTSDARAIVELRKAGVADSIKDLLQRVKASKTTKEYLAEFVIRGPRDERKLIQVFAHYIPRADILRLEVDGAIGRLVLTQNGKRALAEAARKLHTPLKSVIPAILQDQAKG